MARSLHSHGKILNASHFPNRVFYVLFLLKNSIEYFLPFQKSLRIMPETQIENVFKRK